MRLFAALLAATFWLPCLCAQQVSPAPSQELNTALTGDWTGVLEYRDYSEPPTSTRRVKLPTWLTVSAAGSSLRFRYTYDDGPGKTVLSTSVVTVDPKRSIWTSVAEDKPGDKPHVDAIDGLDRLKNGRGVLVLSGPGLENGQPVELRTTVRIGRNLMEMLSESRRPGAGEFSFRDSYTLVRAQPPVPK